MTRFLSESLQAPEPLFRTGIQRLEQAHGNPSHDIRLSSEVMRATKVKLHELNLDAHDTTGRELYHMLQAKIKADDAKLTKVLRTRAATFISAEGDVMAGMVHVLNSLPLQKSCFALKTSKLKSLIKKQPPKKAMKQLGYRSLDSMLKHEPVANVLAAAFLSENSAWQRNLHEQYKHLNATDFENRKLMILHPDSKRWQALAGTSVAATKHNLLSFAELGAIVLLPLPENAPSGSATASLILALHAINEVRASSTYLKLCQVRPDFGGIVQQVAVHAPALDAELMDQPLTWQLVQRYYSRMKHLFSDQVFEAHLQAEDLSWHAIEKVLSHLVPDFSFWHNSAHLALLHDRQPVSLNVLDAALNYCNNLPFEHRLNEHFQTSLWHELLLRYLKPASVERSILEHLQPELAYEPAIAG